MNTPALTMMTNKMNNTSANAAERAYAYPATALMSCTPFLIVTMTYDMHART
jgi:hypothetical protein